MAFSAHCTQIWKLTRIFMTIISKVTRKCISCYHPESSDAWRRPIGGGIVQWCIKAWSRESRRHVLPMGTLVMLLEVGQESNAVLASELSEYQCRTYFDLASLVIDILDDTDHRNYVVKNLFSWFRSDIFFLKIVFRAILQSLFPALWLVDIKNLRNFLMLTLMKARQMM